MIAVQVWFKGNKQVELREQQLPTLQAGQVQIKTLSSAISAGTEMLVYRGQLPTDLALDATLDSLQQIPTYPLQYGYACVGRVEQIGKQVSAEWQDKLVFAFQPHASHFVSSPEQLIPLPDDIEPEAAIFLANMETAVNLVMDGQPLLGERVVVLGQGVVGLLLSGVLAQFPLAQLLTLDRLAGRRDLALRLGAHQSYDPASPRQIAELENILQLPVPARLSPNAGADLIYELSGVPEVLNQAISLCSFSGRIIIGSWYGNKSANIELGGVAHRNRIQFISSQVSSIAPEFSGRWDKTRRFQVAWDMIRKIQPQQLISHRLKLEQASDIYRDLEQSPENVLQAVFIY